MHEGTEYVCIIPIHPGSRSLLADLQSRSGLAVRESPPLHLPPLKDILRHRGLSPLMGAPHQARNSGVSPLAFERSVKLPKGTCSKEHVSSRKPALPLRKSTDDKGTVRVLYKPGHNREILCPHTTHMRSRRHAQEKAARTLGSLSDQSLLDDFDARFDAPSHFESLQNIRSNGRNITQYSFERSKRFCGAAVYPIESLKAANLASLYAPKPDAISNIIYIGPRVVR